MKLRAEYAVIALTLALVIAAAAGVLWPPAASGQVPACVNDTATVVPCPTPVATATPQPTATPSPTPQATPFPVPPPRVGLYQDFSACGVTQVRASYEGTIIRFRVIITRNGLVLPLTQLDFFNSPYE